MISLIAEFLLNIVFSLVQWLLGFLPDISFNVESSAFDYFIGIIQVAAYMLPMNTIFAIIGIIVALTLFRIVIAIIKTVWDLLPLV